MRWSFLPLMTALAASAAAAQQTSYLSWMADSLLRRGVPKDYHYTQATLYLGYEAAYALTQNKTLYTWYKNQVDAIVLNDGTIKGWNYSFHSLDEYRMANNYLYWYNQTGAAKYKSAAGIVRNQLNNHPRTPSGGFWHREPAYPNQMWLDGIFMADSFYAKWTHLFDASNTTAWDDIASQFDHIETHTRNTTSGLLAHGYDESKKASWANPVTGASPLVWDRAVGWYFLSLLEVLEVFPQTHPGYAKLFGYYTSLASALKKTQDASGGWWLIMNEPYPGKKGNYIESSASAMFTLGFFKGIRTGHIASKDYLAAAKKGYETLISKFVKVNADGTLNWEGTVEVGSLNSDASFEYYTRVPLASNDYKGAGPFLLAAYEWESWASAA